jgi:hypothetical protein
MRCFSMKAACRMSSKWGKDPLTVSFEEEPIMKAFAAFFSGPIGAEGLDKVTGNQFLQKMDQNGWIDLSTRHFSERAFSGDIANLQGIGVEQHRLIDECHDEKITKTSI